MASKTSVVIHPRLPNAKHLLLGRKVGNAQNVHDTTCGQEL